MPSQLELASKIARKYLDYQSGIDRGAYDVAKFNEDDEVIAFKIPQVFEHLKTVVKYFPKLRVIQLSGVSIKQDNLPDSLAELEDLETITVHGLRFGKIPEFMLDAPNLKVLRMRKCSINEIPATISQLSNLERLDLGHNSIERLPDELEELNKLEKINLTNNKITQLPASIGNLSNLKDLTLDSNALETLPASIGNLSNLQELDLRLNYLKSLPEELGKLSNVEIMRLDSFYGDDLGSWFGGLVSLKELIVIAPKVKELHADLSKLTKLKKLVMLLHPSADYSAVFSTPQLRKLEICAETLNEEISQLQSLGELTINELKEQSDLKYVCQMENLTFLRLFNYHPKQLPICIGGMKQLTKFIVDYSNLNQYHHFLRDIPMVLLNYTNISILPKNFKGELNPDRIENHMLEITADSKFVDNFTINYYKNDILGQRAWFYQN